MAYRENVPYAGEVQPRSDTDDDNDEIGYPTSTFQYRNRNTNSPDSEPEDDCRRNWNRMNHMLEFDSSEDENCDSNSPEGVLGRFKNVNNVLFDFIEELGLNDDDDDCDTTKKDDEKNTISEDKNTEKVEGENTEENDDTAEERNSLIRFLELSNLFIRNIMAKAYDFAQRTTRG